MRKKERDKDSRTSDRHGLAWTRSVNSRRKSARGIEDEVGERGAETFTKQSKKRVWETAKNRHQQHEEKEEEEDEKVLQWNCSVPSFSTTNTNNNTTTSIAYPHPRNHLTYNSFYWTFLPKCFILFSLSFFRLKRSGKNQANKDRSVADKVLQTWTCFSLQSCIQICAILWELNWRAVNSNKEREREREREIEKNVKNI